LDFWGKRCEEWNWVENPAREEGLSGKKNGKLTGVEKKLPKYDFLGKI